jgi:hypothetical protein
MASFRLSHLSGSVNGMCRGLGRSIMRLKISEYFAFTLVFGRGFLSKTPPAFSIPSDRDASWLERRLELAGS